MASSRIVLIVLVILFASSVAFSQDAQKEQPTPQTPVNASPDPNPSTPKVPRGGHVTAATLIHQVTPAYPKDAKKKHIEGTLVLHAVIAKDGSVQSLEYVSGPPELTDSAIKAVKKWRYKPTLFNGDPIDVTTTISVIFTLGSN